MQKRKIPRFTQIVTGAWRSGNNLNVNLYALGGDGRVYQFYSKQGWKEKVPKIEDPKDEEAF